MPGSLWLTNLTVWGSVCKVFTLWPSRHYGREAATRHLERRDAVLKNAHLPATTVLRCVELHQRRLCIEPE